MSESAFDGTVKEGFKRRFTIINENDFEKYVPDAGKSRFNRAFNNICEWNRTMMKSLRL